MMEFLTVIVVLCLGVVAWSKYFFKGRKVPPGPYPLPILGNIFDVSSSSPYKSLEQLAKKHGPLMSIRFGSVFQVVVSSSEIAKEVLSGKGFTMKKLGMSFEALDHHKLSMAVLPADTTEWKDMRRICKEQLFSRQSLEKSQRLRNEKVQLLIDYVQKCSGMGRAVNIREALFTTTLNFLSATFFSSEGLEFDSHLVADLRKTVEGVMTTISTLSYADLFPILKPFDPLRKRRQAEFYFGRMLDMIKIHLDRRIESRRENPNAPKPDDLLETLVDISLGSDYKFNLEHITHFLFDLYNGTTETSTFTTEWVMTELLRHPDMLSKVKDEVRSVVGGRKMIEDEDIPKLPYLDAVIKEVFRYHSTAPLTPRMADEDAEIDGYFIPKGTPVIINLWAIGRDPSIWHNPERFDPDRFLNSNIDPKGQCFEFVPFGSGKRMCPGMPFALRTIPATVAALVHNFDWKFAEGESERNGQIFTGAALCREAPLMAIPFELGCL